MPASVARFRVAKSQRSRQGTIRSEPEGEGGASCATPGAQEADGSIVRLDDRWALSKAQNRLVVSILPGAQFATDLLCYRASVGVVVSALVTPVKPNSDIVTSVGVIRWIEHEEACQIDAQRVLISTYAHGRCKSGRCNRGGKSCGSWQQSKRTINSVRRNPHCWRANYGYRLAVASGSQFTTRMAGSCERPFRAVRPDATPAGIFSIIQKDAEHHSNLYDDAYMPHMQRLTWSGIALHGGLLPGHPASHGCVRLPFDFAAHLFDLTKLGMRAIVAPSDVAPASIEHPTLFQPKSDAREAAAARLVQAEEAAKKADQARLAALTAWREVAQATIPLRKMQNLKQREEQRLADAEQAISSAELDRGQRVGCGGQGACNGQSSRA